MDETARLWKIFVQDRSNQDIRNRLAETYVPLVRRYARKQLSRLPPNALELDDLVSCGTFGLLDAMDGFDPSRNVKFETYAALRIYGAMKDELRRIDIVPRSVRSKIKVCQKMKKELTDLLGRNATDKDVSEKLGIRLNELPSDVFTTDSTDNPEFANVPASSSGSDPTRRLEQNDLIDYALRGLNYVERTILCDRYLNGTTMKEIGIKVGLSESRISQVHQQALSLASERMTVHDNILNNNMFREPHPSELIRHENLALMPEHHERYLPLYQSRLEGRLPGPYKSFTANLRQIQSQENQLQKGEKKMADVYTAAELAEKIGVSVQKIGAWKRHGIIPAKAVTDDGTAFVKNR